MVALPPPIALGGDSSSVALRLGFGIWSGSTTLSSFLFALVLTARIWSSFLYSAMSYSSFAICSLIALVLALRSAVLRVSCA